MAQATPFLTFQDNADSHQLALAMRACRRALQSGPRLLSLPAALFRHRRMRASLLALTDDQLRDAGISAAALVAAVREPFRLRQGR